MSVRGKKADKSDLHKIINRESKYKNPLNPEDVIFALDIGTRSVVGIVGVEEQGVFQVVDVEVMEHKSRAMMDGQIHEISKVVEVVEIVKEKLESRLGFELTKVAIAAAGRVLKTSLAKVERKLDEKEPITQDVVESLELEGIQIAHMNLQNKYKNDDVEYYCVGHTVVNYYLNGYVMSNLVGHKGKYMGADVLATFLPHTVVDSLNTVMERVGLRVMSLTLEPIAAINASIPEDIRLLNLALVDIGAGTSDIAITKDGSVIAYEMVAVAGDEITEKIAQHYLLDFNTAEKVKIQLQVKDTVEFTDIMGIKHKVKSDEVIKVIEPAVEYLAEVISQKILESNGKAPNAVFCVGGGSQTPELTKFLANKLNMPLERVGIRGTNVIKNVKFINKKLCGPEAITPIGIAIIGLMKRGSDFIQVKVNKKKVKLYNTGKVVVGDAIAASGFTPEQLIPRRGEAITFTLNGKKQTVKGGYGRPAEIFVNSKPASLDTPLNNGDQIRVIPSEKGQPAKVFVEDFVHDVQTKKILFNNNELDITTKVLLNNKPVSLQQAIKDGDKLSIQEIRTIKDLAAACEMDSENFYITVNSVRVDDDYVIQHGDVIKTIYKKKNTNSEIRVDSNIEKSNVERSNQLSQNVNIISEKQVAESLPVHEKAITVSVNNHPIKLRGKSNYIFVDIFKYYKMDLTNSTGRIVLKLNGMPASYTDSLREGDNIEISWM